MKKVALEIALLLLLSIFQLSHTATVSIITTSSFIQLNNGFVLVEFNLKNPQIDVLQADFAGNWNYGDNLVASTPDQLNRKGIVLETDRIVNGKFTQFASSTGPCNLMRTHIITSTPQLGVVEISGVCDSPTNYLFVSNWTISLEENSRTFQLQVLTKALNTADIIASRVSLYADTPSVYGLFNSQGMRQMMNNKQDNYFASEDSLYYFYTLGLAPSNGVSGGCIDLNATGYYELVMLNGDGKKTNYKSGLQLVLYGNYPVHDEWDNSTWAKANTTNVLQDQLGNAVLFIGLNDNDFPAGRVTNANGLPFAHLQAIYTAIYASTVGAIPSYFFPGAFSATLSFPDIAYSGLYTFYDPDSFFAISSLSYSGDEYLFNQAKQAIELSEKWMLPSGQIPHHFIDNSTTPTYIAISGATQTGPNIFWTLSTLKLGRISGDYDWLAERMPAIEKSVSFLLSMYNQSVGLLSVPGSLYIDVFIRANFTSDSNIAMVYLLKEVAEAEEFYGNIKIADTYRSLSQSITTQINNLLWNTTANDHYITNLSPDGTTRDFVDYDANTLAVAWDVAPPNRAQQLLARVDRGKCTHARATYVSEIYYNTTDCFLNNTGDSAVTMGRIGWGDGIARYKVGDYNTFYDLIFNPILNDLVKNTWLYERYTCQASFTHNAYYHEYPETVFMLLREVVYGIYIGLTSIRIAPFPEPPATTSSYTYNVGNVNISYSQELVSICVPGASQKNITLENLHPNTKYQIQEIPNFLLEKSGPDTIVVDAGLETSYATTDGTGALNFMASTGFNVTVAVQVAQ